jgi:hypothetical protein
MREHEVFRLGVREATRAAARVELRFNGVNLVFVSDLLASELRVWSDPVQIMLEPSREGEGLLDMHVRPTARRDDS